MGIFRGHVTRTRMTGRPQDRARLSRKPAEDLNAVVRTDADLKQSINSNITLHQIRRHVIGSLT